MSEEARFLAVRTDADKAKEYRERLRPLLEHAAQVVNEAQRDGLVINFALGRDAYGLLRVQDIQIARPL